MPNPERAGGTHVCKKAFHRGVRLVDEWGGRHPGLALRDNPPNAPDLDVPQANTPVLSDLKACEAFKATTDLHVFDVAERAAAVLDQVNDHVAIPLVQEPSVGLVEG